jgi:hypothetical protein
MLRWIWMIEADSLELNSYEATRAPTAARRSDSRASDAHAVTRFELHTRRMRERVTWSADHALVMTSLDSDLVVRIADVVTVRTHDRNYSFVGRDQAAAKPVAETLAREATVLRIYADGSLEVELIDGALISVQPHPNYEAWEVWEGGRIWVGLPGGGVG